LKEKKWLTNPRELSQYKPQVLIAAKKVGMEIPDTIITTAKEDLIIFKAKYDRIISKSISDMVELGNNADIYDTMTIEISEEIIKKTNSIFFPSLFQELIEKEYEIRSFYLDGEFYSMAIFSQNDKKTEIDFRNYNSKNPNRTIPYKLPDEIEDKLRNLMKMLHILTGSLDIIKSLDGKYVFLECNPVGQFGMTSFPCNYYIDQKIAKYLISNDSR
jgi:ATP-GRASP peptide maturase of grasp-with-spasm system